MKNLRSLFPLLIFLLIISCGGDDDICTSGEATPRLKVKFKDTNNKIVRLDSLYVSVDYGQGEKNILSAGRVDSAFIPLRVDDNTYTDVYIKRRINGTSSKIRVNYNSRSEYVSPACGIKKVYDDVNINLENQNPVVAVEQNLTEIINEDKTPLYLIF